MFGGTLSSKICRVLVLGVTGAELVEGIVGLLYKEVPSNRK